MSARDADVLREQARADQRVVEENRAPFFVPVCDRCGVELGLGHNKCAPAKGLPNCCLDCAQLYDPPLIDEECFL